MSQNEPFGFVNFNPKERSTPKQPKVDSKPAYETQASSTTQVSPWVNAAIWIGLGMSAIGVFDFMLFAIGAFFVVGGVLSLKSESEFGNSEASNGYNKRTIYWVILGVLGAFKLLVAFTIGI